MLLIFRFLGTMAYELSTGKGRLPSWLLLGWGMLAGDY